MTSGTGDVASRSRANHLFSLRCSIHFVAIRSGVWLRFAVGFGWRWRRMRIFPLGKPLQATRGQLSDGVSCGWSWSGGGKQVLTGLGCQVGFKKLAEAKKSFPRRNQRHMKPSCLSPAKRFLPAVPLALVAVLLLCLAVGCGSSSSPAVSSPDRVVDAENPLQVTATVAMVADLVRNVGGERTEVNQLCGSGVDPHLYKVTRDDVLAMRSSDMVFYSGLMLEGKMADALVKEARKRPVIAVTENVPEELLLEPDDFAGHYDPHLWMDVSAWSQCVDVIADELCEFDPEGESIYRRNAESYKRQLSALHQYGQASLATIPKTSRLMVTSHDAFNYFGRAYGLEVTGVQGVSTESEAGLQWINQLVSMIVDRDVKAVFVESSVASDNVEALVEGARAKGHEVKIADKELFSDAMGAPGTYEGTYIGMLDHNITVVTRALGGQANQAGLNGQLQTKP